MKIQCDVCGREEACVFCTADEAALCNNCDDRVHNANKLASKHPRFSLLHPQFKDSPLCDICQERRALLFCQEDRALLCRECDVPLHRSNEHTKRHNRFLLTGVKLSSFAPASSYQTAATSSAESQWEGETKSSEAHFHPHSIPNSSKSSSNPYRDVNKSSQLEPTSTSSISEYLMETLPGWHVEDFLDPASNSHFRLFSDL